MGLLKKLAAVPWSWVPKHPEPVPKRSRADAYSNEFLGYGTSRDKLSAGGFSISEKLQEFELHALYYHDDIGALIVNGRPKEMMRRGYRLVSKTNQDAADALQKKGEALDLDTRVLRGMQWGRWQGGALTIMGALDGSADLAQPLNKGAVTDVTYLTTVDKRYATVQSWQDDPRLPGYGEPLVYAVGSVTTSATAVHATRCLRWDGVPETDPMTRRRLGGWTHSVLQRPYEVMRDFATTYRSIAHLVADASQGVWKIQGLLDLLTANEQELMTRIRFADMTRSAGRAVMVDAENEDFTRVTTSFAGIKDVAEMQMMRLAAASRYPVTILMGRSPAGMNATGDSDFRSWYDELSTDQENELKPQLLRAYGIIGGPAETPEDLDIEFCPLWQPTEAEKATTDKTVAETDQIYVTMGAVLPGQVAIARFGSGEGKIEIDEDAINADLDHEIELMKDPEARAKQEALVAQAAAAKATGGAPPNASKNGGEAAGQPGDDTSSAT